MTHPDAAAAFREAERRLRALLFGDGMDVMGVVRGEERRAQVAHELRRLRHAFDAALDTSDLAPATEPGEARDLEEELRRVAASRSRDRMLLTVPEVAERLRMSRSSVYRRIATGELPALRLGARGPLRIDARELDRLLRATENDVRSLAGEAAPRMNA